MGVLKRLFGYVRPYWKMLVATGILLLLQTGLSLLPPLLQRDIVDQVIGHHDLSRLGTVIVGLIGVYALLFLTEVGDQYIRHVLGARFILDLRV
ncbi:MAG: ABC transporter ATP-binding protein, partial [Anaerolineae bacterium]